MFRTIPDLESFADMLVGWITQWQAVGLCAWSEAPGLFDLEVDCACATEVTPSGKPGESQRVCWMVTEIGWETCVAFDERIEGDRERRTALGWWRVELRVTSCPSSLCFEVGNE